MLKEKKASVTHEDLEIFTSTIHSFVYDVLGLVTETAAQGSNKLEGVVNMLIGMRKQARDNKDWSLSDLIRDELSALGIQLKDGKEGTSFTVEE